MKFSTTKHTYFFYVSVLLIVYLTVPVFNWFFDFKASLSIVLFSFASLVLYTEFLKTKMFLYWIWFSFVVLVNHFLGDGYFIFNVAVLQVVMTYSVFSMAFFFIAKKNLSDFGLLALISVSIALAFSIISIPLIINNPSFIRDIGSLTDKENLQQGNIWFVSYAMLHGLPFIFPPIVYFIRNSNGILKFFLLTMLLIFMVVIVLADATTSLIIGLGSIVMSLIIKQNKSIKHNLVRVSIVIVFLIVFINIDLLLYLLNLIQPFFEGFSTSKKIDQIKSLLIFNSTYGDVGSRFDLYEVSWGSFKENIFFGTNTLYGIGKHSFFIDILASLGIVGFIPLALMIIEHIKRIYYSLTFLRIYYLVGVISFLLMFTLKNLFSFEIYLYAFVFLPGICFKIESIKS